MSVDWEELERVAHYLQTVEPSVGDRDVLCWDYGTHPLYLRLEIEPPLRYMHWDTAFEFRSKADHLTREVSQARFRFVVSDFQHMMWNKTLARAPGLDGRPEQLPYWFPRSQVHRFPWNQPIVFRAGRYAVHRIARPVQPHEVEPPLLREMPRILRPGINEWAGAVARGADLGSLDPAYLDVAKGDATAVLDNGPSWEGLNRLVGFDRSPPVVDFSRFVAVVGVSRGEQVTLSAVPRHGNLQAGIESARRQAPGVRYQIVVLPRDGIETVNGQPLRSAQALVPPPQPPELTK